MTGIARIKKGAQVLEDNLEIIIEVSEGSNGLVWYGAFSSRNGITYLNEEQSLEIEVDGNVGGRILVTDYNPVTTETRFQGTGLLKLLE